MRSPTRKPMIVGTTLKSVERTVTVSSSWPLSMATMAVRTFVVLAGYIRRSGFFPNNMRPLSESTTTAARETTDLARVV